MLRSLYPDNPAFPLLQAHISYWGITTANGLAAGTTLVCDDLANQPSYATLTLKILDGPSGGQVRSVDIHLGNTIAVAAPFTNAAGAAQQILAGTRFAILSFTGGGGGLSPVPGVGLWMFGVCNAAMPASLDTLFLTNLANFPDDIFNNEFWVQVIHNADVPGAAPEREVRRVLNYVGALGVFTTDPFSANVEANDLVCVFHESIMAVEILGFGTLDTSSATVPADSTRAENDYYFRGCLLMPTEGACRFQPKRIVDYTGVGGIFTIDPNNPFSAVTGDVDYVIIGAQAEFVPAADGANNRTPSDVIGNKTDTAIAVADDVSSAMRYLKGLMAMAGREVRQMDFWSVPQEELSIPAAGATRGLPNVVVADLPATAVVVRAIAMVKFRMVENTNQAANKLDGATVAATSQVIQVRDDTPGTWRDAIVFVDDQFGIAGATREGGDVLMGDTDIAVEVDGNDIYEFQYLEAKADLDSINWNDVQVGLRVYYL